MLVAMDATNRLTVADLAERTVAYRCPQCDDVVVIKRGTMVAAHFAHRADSACAWAKGETAQHLAAKSAIAASFGARGLLVRLEAEVLSCVGDRRADVLVEHPANGARVAIEIQHSPLDLNAIQDRTRAYCAANVAVIWVPTLDRKNLNLRSIGGDVLVAERYSVPGWQRFAAAYHGMLWFWMDGALWRGWLDDAWIPAPTRDPLAGEGWMPSRRWAVLTIEGPFVPASLRIQLRLNVLRSHETFQFPPGPSAHFVVDGEPKKDFTPAMCAWRERDGRSSPYTTANKA